MWCRRAARAAVRLRRIGWARHRVVRGKDNPTTYRVPKLKILDTSNAHDRGT